MHIKNILKNQIKLYYNVYQMISGQDNVNFVLYNVYLIFRWNVISEELYYSSVQRGILWGQVLSSRWWWWTGPLRTYSFILKPIQVLTFVQKILSSRYKLDLNIKILLCFKFEGGGISFFLLLSI
jgi:hypothetical protein